ncbi:FecR/PupR family sigma factor regulator, partial [Steroidobacter sp.]|uniref:FecR/PupR family sigma factor regulator n=1 Tax=Steroidobacter sp. TaxID=1978227 RepID=UPI001A532B2C
MENSAQVHEAAAVWLAKRDCGEWTPEDEAKLEAWLNESTGNRVAFIRLESAWREADRIGMLGVGVKPGVIPPRDDPKRGRWQVAAKHLASAASIAA